MRTSAMHNIGLGRWSGQLVAPGSLSMAGTWTARSLVDQIFSQALSQTAGLLGNPALWMLHRTNADRLGLVEVLTQAVASLWITVNGLTSGLIGTAITLLVPMEAAVGFARRSLRMSRSSSVRAAGLVVTALVLMTQIGAASASSAYAATTASAVQKAAVPAHGMRLRVATYNVRSVAYDSLAKGNERPGRERRTEIIADVLRERIHVLGLQEASQNPRYGNRLVDGPNQYLDLRNGLNRAGGRFEVTDARVEASRGTRILYDTTQVALVRDGVYTYRAQSAGANDTRYLVWAEFRDLETGSHVFFADTHLVTGSGKLQQRQWAELIDEVRTRRGGLPVVVVGDFQRSRLKHPAADMMTDMKRAGFADVLGQRPLTVELTHPRPRHLTNAWVNSFNAFDRNVADFGYENHKDDAAGNNADWIFASADFGVRNYEVVLHMDPRTLRLQGVIPSDHNMVRATLTLPSA